MMRAAVCGPMPSMVVSRRADLVVAQFAFDVALDFAQAAAQQVEVLAGVAGLQAVGRAVVLADGALCGLDQRAASSGPTLVAAVVAQAWPGA